MENDIAKTQREISDSLNISLENATSIITKSYLDKLETYEIMKPSAEDVDIDIAQCGRFFKLSKLVVNKEENFLNKLTTIVNVASAIDSSLATVIKSDGNGIEYFMGIISKNYRGSGELNERRRTAAANAMKGAINGNLIGSDIEEVADEELLTLLKAIFTDKNKSISSISGIVALRDGEDKSIDGYVQGIENLVDSLRGQKYSIVLIADPIRSSEIQVIKQGYEMIYTQLASFLKSSVTLNETDHVSLSKAQTDGVTQGITTGIAMTQSKTKSRGKFKSVNASVGISMGITASAGVTGGSNTSEADTQGRTQSQNETNQRVQSATKTVSTGMTSGKSLQLNYENRSVKALLDKIDKHLDRLDMCESFGAFDCAAYVITQSREEALTVASNYNALMRGEESSVQASHINTWHKEADMDILNQYLMSFVHPRFRRRDTSETEERIIFTPASIVNGNEIAIQIGLPKKSVNGVTVVPMAPFGRNVMKPIKGQGLVLGDLYHMGHDDAVNGGSQKVEIDVESLSMHTFITGSTGTGKSNVIYSILDKLMTHPVKDKSNTNVKFLVIEPAKGEYKDRFANYDKINLYGTNYKKMPLLKINPFSFPEDIHVLEHIDRLIEIFNVCWPMYAAMPAILKDAIERSYVCAGWNLDTSQCRYAGAEDKKLYPGFIDVLQQINVVMEESKYSSDSKGDYKGALCTRVKSFTNGLYGQIFTNDELTAEELFEENVIIDLSRIGSVETKSLIMGLLVMKLREYRMATKSGNNTSLKHVTVLEEAHNLLRRTSTEQSSETANLLGKSVEMLANSIAEMRTYGEGFIIADQAPGLMDMSVIRNTNTKIILRLPDYSDRELVGKSAALNDDQVIELSKLKTFVAAVYQNNWLEPVLCNMDVTLQDHPSYEYVAKLTLDTSIVKQKYIEYLLLPLPKKQQLDKIYVSDLKEGVFKLHVPTDTKVAFIKYAESDNKDEVQRLRSKIVYNIFNSEIAMDMAVDNKSNIDIWYKDMIDSLDPSIEKFAESDRQKIIALITKEKAYIDESREAQELFDKLMKRIGTYI